MASSVLYALVWIWRRAGVDEDISVLGRVNFRTVGYVVFTWAFVGFSVVAAAMADCGVLGMRLWRY